MNRFVRIALTLLLALALPLQGYAAGTRVHCGPNHHGQKTVEHVAPPVPHAHADGMAHHHAQPMAVADAKGIDGASLQDGDADSAFVAKLGKPLTGKCGICASCCSTAAIVSKPVVLALPAAPPVYDISPLEPDAGFTPGGLERPPRQILA